MLAGWQTKIFRRGDGSHYAHFIAPEPVGWTFRSRVEVARFLSLEKATPNEGEGEEERADADEENA